MRGMPLKHVQLTNNHQLFFLNAAIPSVKSWFLFVFFLILQVNDKKNKEILKLWSYYSTTHTCRQTLTLLQKLLFKVQLNILSLITLAGK